MAYIYTVKPYSPRSFNKNIFLKNGDSAVIKIEGSTGIIECANKIPDKDLHFIFKLYNLVDEISYINTNTTITTTTVTTTTKMITSYNVSFSEDI